MIKHTLEISERAARIRLKDKQLVIEIDDEKRSFACEDIGVLVLQNPAVSISAATLDALCQSGAAIVICGQRRLPTGLLLPIPTHTQLVPRMMAQLSTSRSVAKQAWKQIVQAKILAQARNLKAPYADKLKYMASKVRSGDPENYEAQASKLYWPNCFQEEYNNGDQRNPENHTPFNICLNYGYAIIRAAVARSLVSAGLVPALGIFHKRRDNPYCLADDLMEPLRPLVDATVRNILTNKISSLEEPLGKESRKQLLTLLTYPVSLSNKRGPMMAVLPRYVNNYVRFITGESKRIIAPIT